jgi:hypothetical protein
MELIMIEKIKKAKRELEVEMQDFYKTVADSNINRPKHIFEKAQALIDALDEEEKVSPVKHTILQYIAPRAANRVLNFFEGDKVKVFCRMEEMTFSTSSPVTEEKFRETMKRSKQAFERGEEDFWIAGISYMDNFFKENESSVIVV